MSKELTQEQVEEAAIKSAQNHGAPDPGDLYIPEAGVSLKTLIELHNQRTQDAVDLQLSTLDIEGKLLLLKSDDLSENLIDALRKGVQAKGVNVLGIIAIGTDSDLSALEIADLENMVAQLKAKSGTATQG